MYKLSNTYQVVITLGVRPTPTPPPIFLIPVIIVILGVIIMAYIRRIYTGKEPLKGDDPRHLMPRIILPTNPIESNLVQLEQSGMYQCKCGFTLSLNVRHCPLCNCENLFNHNHLLPIGNIIKKGE